MGKVERRRFFERLCELRDAYARRGPDDRLPTLTVEAAIACAELALVSVRMVGEAIPDTQATELERRR